MKKIGKITYFSKSDNLGRCSFMLEWKTNYIPGFPLKKRKVYLKGQCFFADPREYGHPRPEEVGEKIQGADYEKVFKSKSRRR